MKIARVLRIECESFDAQTALVAAEQNAIQFHNISISVRLNVAGCWDSRDCVISSLIICIQSFSCGYYSISIIILFLFFMFGFLFKRIIISLVLCWGAIQIDLPVRNVPLHCSAGA